MSSEKDPTQALKILSGFRHGPDITSVTFNKRAAIKKTERLGLCPNKGPSSLVPPSPKFLDVIPYPSSYPCQSVSEWVGHGFRFSIVISHWWQFLINIFINNVIFKNSYQYFVIINFLRISVDIYKMPIYWQFVLIFYQKGMRKSAEKFVSSVIFHKLAYFGWFYHVLKKEKNRSKL